MNAKSGDMKWAVAIHATNDVVADGIFFTELAVALKLYANRLDTGECGQAPCEVFVSPGGTRLTVIAEGYFGEPVRL